MNYLLKILRAFFLAGLIGAILFSSRVYAMEILPAAQLTAGMKGYAKTVIEGDRIDSFAVEIIGVLKDGDDSEGKIIARVSGDVIDKTGGVLQGMSGSPVYIDGKLIGAISGGWKDVDNKTCLITPIQDMLEIWRLPDEKNKNRIKQVDLKAAVKANEKAVEKQKTGEKNKQKNGDLPTDEKLDASLASPLFVSGFGEAGMALLKEKLQPLQLVPYMTGSPGGSPSQAVLEPGSSVGVQLVRGDITMAAIGTVTAVENGRILAFGHPFLRKGNVNYFMTNAQIVTTASGETAGFKVGVPGKLVGRISQDRTAAVAGVIGEYPSVVPLRVSVEDAQLKRKKVYDMQVAYDEELLPALISTMVYNAMDKARDRLGDGTAAVSFEIMTNSVPSGTFKRDNMFYNAQDVGQVAVAELAQALNLLAVNSEAESDIVAVKVAVQLDEMKKTASLIEAVPDKASVKPGETVHFKVKVKPYRQAEEILNIAYKVPKNQPEGMLNLEIRGGGLVPLMQALMMQQGIDPAAQEDKRKPLSAKLEELAGANRNNEILVSPAPLIPEEMNMVKPKKKAKGLELPEGAAEQKGGENLQDKGGDAAVKHKTPYIIDNVLQVPIKIEAAK